MKITENMKVYQVLDINDGLEKVFLKHDLPCMGCPGALEETLREAAEGHNIDINELLKDLNKQV